MQCLRIHEWAGELEQAEVNRPTAGTNDVVVDIAATGVGRTVVNVINGEINDDPAALPRIPGHELVGTVVECGDGVTNLEEGDYVTAYMYLSCGYCQYCRSGQDSLCDNFGGIVGAHTDGGYAEYARLPAKSAISIPEEIDPVDATTIADAVGTPYHIASERANISPGESVMVLGAGGGVGIHLVQVAQHFGGSVTAVDIDDNKLDVCADLDANRTVNVDAKSLTEAIGSVEYDIVVDFTGVMSYLEEAVDMLAPRGRLVNLTTFSDRSFDVSPRVQVFNELEVVGSRYCSKAELVESASLVADGVVTPVVSETVSLSEVPALHDRIVNNEVVGRGAVVPSQ